MSHHALILAAGLGTRLRPLTAVRAKPAMPVAGTPIVRRIIRWLAQHDVRRLVLNLHHRPETLTAVVGDGSDLGVRVRYSWEQPAVLGSAGGPRLALPLLADVFFLVNGDTLTDVDLGPVIAAHRRSGALVTLALTPNREPQKYGGVLIDRDGLVTGFTRPGPPAASSYHFIGVQLARSEAFLALPPGRAARSIGEVYDDLIATRPGSLRGIVCEAAFSDIGTVADYWRTSLAFIAAEPHGTGWVGAGVRVHETARLTRTIVWDEVDIGAHCVLDECIVTDRVAVPPGTTARRSILFAEDGRMRTAALDPG
jgi:mannose-1-phosphate guanylyltransferase